MTLDLITLKIFRRYPTHGSAGRDVPGENERTSEDEDLQDEEMGGDEDVRGRQIFYFRGRPTEA